VYLAHHFFPDVGSSGGVGDVDVVQHQVRRLEPLVVTSHAVLIEGATGYRRGRDRADGRAWRGSYCLLSICLMCGSFNLQAGKQGDG